MSAARHSAAPQAEPALLEIEHLTKRFTVHRTLVNALGRRPAASFAAVDDLSLTIRRGEVVGLVGESGSGKSTVARCIVGLLRPDEGTVLVNGHDVGASRGPALAALRRQAQMIYQDPYSSLNPKLTIGAAIEEPAIIHGVVAKQDGPMLARQLLSRVGLSEQLYDRRPRALSGGQRQRVAIARALAVQPELMVADEAVSALDVSVQAQILNLFDELRTELHMAILFIAHQLSVVALLADRVAIMYMGKLVEEGPTAEVFQHPRHPYTVALLAANPSIDGKRITRSVAVKGEIPSPFSVSGGCRFRTRCPLAEEKCAVIEPPTVMLASDHMARCHAVDSSSSPSDIRRASTTSP